MRILHLSDIHLAENGQIIWDTDTKCHFDKTIKKIREITDIDAIIVSGDLSNDGSRWTYKYIDNQFASLGIPTYCCPGNHDNINMILNEYQPNFYKIQTHIDIKGWRFYFLNSVIADENNPRYNKARGMISQKQLITLEESLKNNVVPSIIVFHHPALEPGGWLNRRLLENRDEFNNIIKKHSHVKLILYGHIHYGIQQEINGIIYSAAPSIGYAYDKELPKFQIAVKQEGFNLIELKEEIIKIKKINIHY